MAKETNQEGTKTPEELAAEQAKSNQAGQADGIDLENLTPELQNLLNAGFRKGAEKKEGEVTALKEQLAQTQTLMDTLKASQTLSEQEKEGLKTNMDEIRKQFQSKEQTLSEDFNTLKASSAKEIGELKENRDYWKGTFIDGMIRKELSEAAVEAKAWMPGQVVRMLYDDSHVVEDIDEATKQLKGYRVEIRLPVEEDGKQVVKGFNVTDGVSAFLKENPNLLTSQITPGAGVQGSQSFRTPQGIVTQADIENPDNYDTPEKIEKIFKAVNQGDIIP